MKHVPPDVNPSFPLHFQHGLGQASDAPPLRFSSPAAVTPGIEVRIFRHSSVRLIARDRESVSSLKEGETILPADEVISSACEHSLKHAPAIRRRRQIPSLEDNTMEIAEQVRFDVAQRPIKNRDAIVLLGYSISAIVLLIVIYFGSMSSGTAVADFESMIVFP